MGITSEIPVNRSQIEMYLHLLLLISPVAFGMPSSPLIDIGLDIINKLDSFPGITEETKAVFENSNLTSIVDESLKEAEKVILEMETELKLLETEEVQFEDNYFPSFNKAKRYLRESRQNLRKLADRTVSEVRDLKVLLKDLDESNDTQILKFSLEKMKDLMIETLETLKDALGKYNSALETFENLNSSIEKQNRKLEKMVTKDSAEFKAWTEEMRGGIYGTIAGTTTACIVADALGALGICSAINAAISASVAAGIETEIKKADSKLQLLKSITGRMLDAGRVFDITIDEAIGILTDEIELINNWTNSAEVVNRNIDKYPKEYLKKYIAIRTVFINGLDDLRNSAEDFLAQPVDILG